MSFVKVDHGSPSLAAESRHSVLAPWTSDCRLQSRACELSLLGLMDLLWQSHSLVELAWQVVPEFAFATYDEKLGHRLCVQPFC